MLHKNITKNLCKNTLDIKNNVDQDETTNDTKRD